MTTRTYYDDTYDDNDNINNNESVRLPEKDVQHVWFMAFAMNGSKVAKRDVTCWHCGDRGHFAGECPINLSNQPQTSKGVDYYAAFNRTRNEVRPYDAQAQKDRSEKYQQRSRENKSNNAPASNSSSSNSVSQRKDKYNRYTSNKRRNERSSKNKRVTFSDNNDSAIEVSSHIIELPHHDSKNEVSDSDDDHSSEKRVFQMFTISNVTNNDNTSLKDIQYKEAQESTSATSLCLPVEINGQPVGYALGDQGCNRTCMRASALQRTGLKVNEHKLTNQFLLCSSGEEIPIRSRFKATISSKGKTIGESLVYVVDDKPNADIVCDIVIGRSTLSSGEYNCIDTKKGTLFNKRTGDEIACTPGKIIDTTTGRKNIVPKHVSNKHHNNINNQHDNDD